MPQISLLENVETGRKQEPLRYLFYGPEGVGKSTLAAHAPKPIFLDVEKGTGHLDAVRYPLGGTFANVLHAVDDLRHNSHEYSTLVIDTVDALEGLIWQHCFERDSKGGKELTCIEDYGYGKGYTVAQQEWRLLISKLEALRLGKEMEVVMLAHSHVKTFRNPEGEDWDRYQLRVNHLAAGLLKDWSDMVGFCHFEQGAVEKDSGGIRGVETGRRILGLRRTATSDGKTRLAVSTTLELEASNPWSPLFTAVHQARSMTPDRLISLINMELERLNDDELTANVNNSVAASKSNVAALNRYLLRLQEKASPAS